MAMRMTVARKLTGLCLCAAASLVGIGGLAVLDANELAAHSGEIERVMGAMRSQMTANMAHDAIRGWELSALLSGAQADAAGVQRSAQEIARQRKVLEESIDAMARVDLGPAAAEAVASVRSRSIEYVRQAEEIAEAASRDMAQAEALRPAFRQAYGNVEVDLKTLGDLVKKAAEAVTAESADVRDRAVTMQVAGTLVAVLLIVALAAVTVRSITRRLGGEPEDVAALAQAIAGGDLSRPIEAARAAPDSIVAAMAHMQASLKGIVSAVRHSADSIAVGSREIALGNADLSQRTEEQASNLQRTASTMDEIHATVTHSAEAARSASQVATEASAAATAGGEAVRRVVEVMGEISTSANRIGEIIAVIDGIAFQTNILALNAAVEAARAGEQGRGFAVVAGEVRSLARRCTEAAREIKGLIGDSVEKVENGSRLVGVAGSTIDGVVSQVQRVTDLIAEIDSAVQEQSTGIGEVNRAVSELDQVTQQNAALVEEAAAAADSLKGQAQSLVGVVSVFRLEAAVPQPEAPVGDAARHAPLVKPLALPAAIPAAAASAAAVPRPRLQAKPQLPHTRPAAVPAPAEDEWASF